MLLGRAQECRTLDHLLAEARAGRSGVLGLVGEAGIGKTVLLEYVAEQAHDLRLLTARGVPSEASIPFAALSDLLGPALAVLDRIPQPQAEALSGALAIGPPAVRDRFAIGAATLSLLSAYAEDGPLLVLVDDAHLLDRPSAAALLFAARRLLADQIAVVLAAREGEPSLLDESGLRTLGVGGIRREAVTELLPELKQEAADRLFAATGGNPLALLELAGEPLPPVDVPVEISARISTAFLQRAQRLPAETRDVLVVAATSGSGNVGVVAEACRALGLSIEALSPAEDIGLVHLTDGELRFRHPLLRAAVYSEATPATRRAVHAALAGVLPDRDADRRAWHLAAAALGPDGRASRALAQAGARARERNAYEVAARAYEQAAALDEVAATRAGLLFDAAACAALAGEPQRALTTLLEARPLIDDPDLSARVGLLTGQIQLVTGPVLDGSRLIASAADHVGLEDPEQAVVMLAEAVRGALYALDTAPMGEYAARAFALAPRANSRKADFFANMCRAVADVVGGDAQRGIDAARTAVAILEESDEIKDDPRHLVWAAIGPMWLRDAKSGRDLIERAQNRIRVEGALGVLPTVLQHLGRDQATTDQWTAAQSTYDEAIRIARETGQLAELAAALAGRAWLDARQGREAECRRGVEEADAMFDALQTDFYRVWAVQALGDLELGLGRPADAARHHEAQRALMTSLGFVDVDLTPDPELVEAYLRLHRYDEARAAAARYVSAAEAKGQPWALARARRCEGMVSGADAEFEDALVLHATTPDAFETARTRLAYGAALRRTRRKIKAREQLHLALDTFLALGAASWAEQSSAELAATGEVARRRDVSTLVQLTPQEFQVAKLLAEGRTTREAAAAVFLSPKTVEYHLRSVYRKLGIRSREELTRVIGEG